MVERLDWGDGGEGGGRSGASPNAIMITSGDPLGAVALQREMESWRPTADVPAGAALDPAPSPASGALPAVVEREINHSADGREATLAYMQETARGIIAESGNPAAFVAHFDALSESVQAKMYLALMRNPGASFLDVLDATEPKLTLAEMAEAERWVRAWKAKQ